jgi:hypothetical protein
MFLASVISLSAVSISNGALPPGYAGTVYTSDTLLGHAQQIPGVVKGVFVDNGVTNNLCCTDQLYSTADYDEVGYGTNGQLDSSDNATHPTSHLGWMSNGECCYYTVHVNTAGAYYVDFKEVVANAPPNLQTLKFYNGTKVKTDSVPNLPVCTIPPGCPEIWHAWNCYMGVDSVVLDTGIQVFQITFNLGGWNYDWMRFRIKGATQTQLTAGAVERTAPLDLKTEPNGARLVLSYHAGSAAAGKISLVNSAGENVTTLVDDNRFVGRRSKSFDAGELRQGVYFATVECGGIRETKSFSIIR